MQCERTSSSHVCGLLKRLRIAVGSGGCRRPAAIRRTNTPQILPVGSVRRKLSGSLPGCRSATYAARRIASATASASSWITDASFAMGIPFRSQSIPNTDALANFKRKVTPDVEWPLLKPFQTPAVASLCRHHQHERRIAISPALDRPARLACPRGRRGAWEVLSMDGAPLPTSATTPWRYGDGSAMSIIGAGAEPFQGLMRRAAAARVGTYSHG
jgi:hypothetical protein